MSSPFVAEIRVVGFNFAPTGWAQCNGQILPIAQNTALFSLLGTMYGGNGQTTFALPSIEGQVVVGPGQGPGLSNYDQGQTGGAETTTLLESEMPAHTHTVHADSQDPATQMAPAPDRALARSRPGRRYQTTSSNLVALAPEAAAPAGGGLPHNNMSPALVLNFIIALQGVFPPRQ
jgi:microcystin-dependent protein